MAEKMSIDKHDPVKEDSEDSGVSSPEGESVPAPNQQQQPKRKGGRKPIYATSEERKQRNRQAQAAFRERRTEYIKQLEETIRVHEQNLHNLQAAHRHAADECLMLRYKNSLLERVLLEKGIDVQAELRAKTGSPNLGPTHMPQNLVQPPPLPRALLNRHHPRRSTSSIAPKLEPGAATLPTPSQGPPTVSTLASPKSRPTVSSLSDSPATTATSAFGASPAGSGSEHVSASMRGVSRPATATLKPQPQLQPMPPIAPMGHPRPLHRHLSAAPTSHSVGTPESRTSGGPYYQSTAFQNHIEQLEQEYEAAADIMDETGEGQGTPSLPGPYTGGTPFSGEQHGMNLSSPSTSGPQMDGHTSADHGISAPQSQQGGYPSMTQLLDPALDWDPFGLSASMQFPPQFSFDTSNMR